MQDVQKDASVWPSDKAAFDSSMNSLKSWKEFQTVMSGSINSRTAYFSLHSCDKGVLDQTINTKTEKEQILFGALVPKRFAKRAVTRNSIKRQIRSVLSEQTNLSERKAYVIRLHKDLKSLYLKSANSEVLKKLIRNDLIVLFDKLEYK